MASARARYTSLSLPTREWTGCARLGDDRIHVSHMQSGVNIKQRQRQIMAPRHRRLCARMRAASDIHRSENPRPQTRVRPLAVSPLACPARSRSARRRALVNCCAQGTMTNLTICIVSESTDIQFTTRAW